MHMTLAIVAAALGAALVYAIVAAIQPFGRCMRCSGTGQRRLLIGRGLIRCHHCRGTGDRQRIGWRIANHVLQVRAEARRAAKARAAR